MLHPRRKILSTYFDTDNFDLYTDSEEGVIPRKKIRVRTYNSEDHSSNDNALEVKISSVEGRFKTVEKLTHDKVDSLFSYGLFDSMYGDCRPVASISYNREYFQVRDVRLTIDTDIEYCATNSMFPLQDDSIAVEIKAGFTTSINMLTQAFPFRRVRFSKYARSITAIQKGSCEWF